MSRYAATTSATRRRAQEREGAAGIAAGIDEEASSAVTVVEQSMAVDLTGLSGEEIVVKACRHYFKPEPGEYVLEWCHKDDKTLAWNLQMYEQGHMSAHALYHLCRPFAFVGTLIDRMKQLRGIE